MAPPASKATTFFEILSAIVEDHIITAKGYLTRRSSLFDPQEGICPPSNIPNSSTTGATTTKNRSSLVQLSIVVIQLGLVQQYILSDRKWHVNLYELLRLISNPIGTIHTHLWLLKRREARLYLLRLSPRGLSNNQWTTVKWILQSYDPGDHPAGEDAIVEFFVYYAQGQLDFSSSWGRWHICHDAAGQLATLPQRRLLGLVLAVYSFMGLIITMLSLNNGHDKAEAKSREIATLISFEWICTAAFFRAILGTSDRKPIARVLERLREQLGNIDRSELPLPDEETEDFLPEKSNLLWLDRFLPISTHRGTIVRGICSTFRSLLAGFLVIQPLIAASIISHGEESRNIGQRLLLVWTSSFIIGQFVETYELPLKWYWLAFSKEVLFTAGVIFAITKGRAPRNQLEPDLPQIVALSGQKMGSLLVVLFTFILQMAIPLISVRGRIWNLFLRPKLDEPHWKVDKTISSSLSFTGLFSFLGISESVTKDSTNQPDRFGRFDRQLTRTYLYESNSRRLFNGLRRVYRLLHNSISQSFAALQLSLRSSADRILARWKQLWRSFAGIIIKLLRWCYIFSLAASSQGLGAVKASANMVIMISSAPWRCFRKPPTENGYRRIEWTCGCGKILYGDFDSPGETELDELHRALSPSQAPRPDHTSRNAEPKAKNDTAGSPYRNRQLANTPAIPESMRLSNDAAESGESPSSDRLIRLPSQGNTRPKYLAICVSRSGIYKAVTEIEMSAVTSDASLFQRIQDAYYKSRGPWAKFTIFRKPMAVEFIRFNIWNRRNGYISICERPKAVPSKKVGTYDFNPRPIAPMPPMPSEPFIHYLENGSDCFYPNQNVWTPRLPKRLDKRIIDCDIPGYGWGIYIREGPNRVVIFWIVMVTIAAAVLLCILWSYLTGAAEVGAALATLVVALPSVIMAAFMFKHADGD